MSPTLVIGLLIVDEQDGNAHPRIFNELCSLGLVHQRGGTLIPIPLPPKVSSHYFELTARGKAMVQALLQLPLPQAEYEMQTKWAIPGTDFEFAESEL